MSNPRRYIYNLSSIYLAFLIVILPLSYVLDGNYSTPFIGYSDEIVALFCGFYIFMIAGQRKLKRNDISIIITLFLCICIGLVSNAISRIIDIPMAILVDILWLCKIYFVYIAIKYMAKPEIKIDTIRILMPLGKMLILFSLFFGTINLFYDIGMSTDIRYGIRSFCFVFKNPGPYGLIIASCMAIVLSSNTSKEQKRLYTIMAVIVMIYTTKGVVFIVAVSFLILSILFKYTNKLSFRTVLPLGLVGSLVGMYQIQTYLIDTSVPRMRFIQYGIVTANRYFPFGSGFATYGSEMAKRYYSALYDQYGFNNYWGMSEEYDLFLNDNFSAMIIGQFGWIGFMLFYIALFKIYKQLDASKIRNSEKAIVIALFIGIVVSSIATAIIKSSTGVFVFSVLGLIIAGNEHHMPKDKQTMDLGEMLNL